MRNLQMWWLLAPVAIAADSSPTPSPAMTNATVASSTVSGAMSKLSRFLASDLGASVADVVSKLTDMSDEEVELDAFDFQEGRQLSNNSSPAPPPIIVGAIDTTGILVAAIENATAEAEGSGDDNDGGDDWIIPVVVAFSVVFVIASAVVLYFLRALLFKVDTMATKGSRMSMKFDPDNSKYLYFLSHKKFHSKFGKQPEAIAMHIHDVLKLKGYKGFFDTDNLRTISEHALEEAIEKSLSLIVFMHDETVQSEWCLAEWKMAEKHGVPCIVVCDIQRCDKAKLLNSITSIGCTNLLAHQWVDYTDALRAVAIDKLTALLGEVLEQGKNSDESRQVHTNTHQQPGQQKNSHQKPKKVTRQVHHPQQLPGQVEDEDENMTAVLPST